MTLDKMVGIDLVDIGRIRDIYQRHGLLFLKKILNDSEIADLPRKENRYFFKKLCCFVASKEAIFKASDREDLDWKDIFISNITKTPLIYIKNADLSKKIKLAFAINGDIVISQAIITHN